MLAADFGDAPLPYPTMLAENGARHEATGPTLGMDRDTETDGTHSADARADGADEDGVTFGTVRVGQLGASVTVNVQNAVTGSKLDAWIDFNGDGSWGGPFEQIFDSVDVSAGDNNLTFDVPSWADDGTTMARFRLSTAGDQGVGGSAADGEVEDYQVEIIPPVATSGVFGGQNIISTDVDYAISVFAADVDGDGDIDVLSASDRDDKIAWYENDGSEGFTPHTISNAANGAWSVFAADVDGDGDIDVLSALASDDAIAWYENDGSQNFTLHTISTTAPNARSVFAADVDGDGNMDVLSASSSDNTIAWYENDGSQNFTSHDITTGAVGAMIVFAADVDGDGDMDVLSTSFGDDKIAWYENDGSQDFTPRTISAAANGAYSVFAADVDGDGDTDVLAASTSRIAWYENDGSEGFTPHTISNTVPYAYSVFAADMDGDGDLDVLSRSWNDDKIAWYENDGSQNFTPHKISTAANGLRSVFAADVDGDGDLDVLGASDDNHKIAWYENLDTLTLSITADSIAENGGVTTATATRADQTGDLTVNLVSDDTSEATVVASVLIADGQTMSAPFNITGVDDAVHDDTQTVTITASATGYASVSDTLDVTDDDDQVLSLDIAADSIAENGGVTAATVTRNTEDAPETKLIFGDASWGDEFGQSVAISGTTAIVGAVGDKDRDYMGSANIFEQSGGTWNQVAKLTKVGEAASDDFGQSVSISDATAIVGAPRYGHDAGAAYIFEQSGGTWSQVAHLMPIDLSSYDYFGSSVAISGSTAIVGAPEAGTAYDNGPASGAAYIFERSVQGWTQVAKLTADDGSPQDHFGQSVSISGTTAIVGAYLDNNDNGSSAGSAYIFEQSGGTWSQVAMLTASDGAAFNHFGQSVSISDVTAIVGAPWYGSDAGAAYIFERSGGTWSQVAKLMPSDLSSYDYFGSSVAISGSKTIVGNQDYGLGSTYVFERSEDVWSQVGKLTASDGRDDDRFGWSVAVSGTTAVVGAWGDDDKGDDAGSTYVFDVLHNQLEVSLSSNDQSEVTVPSTVIIPMGQSSASFTIDALDDGVVDGEQTVTITASASDYTSGSDTLDVIDDGYHGWQNRGNRFDVNGRDGVTPEDVLTLIVHLNAGNTSLPAPPATPPPFYDVNDDNACTPLDVLLVIVFINNRQLAESGEGEATQFPAAAFAIEMPSSPSLTVRLTSPPLVPNGQTSVYNERSASLWAMARTGDVEMPRDANCAQPAFADGVWGDWPVEELDAAFAELDALLPSIAADLIPSSPSTDFSARD